METISVAAGTPVFRIHRRSKEPIYFDDGPGGRFNPRGVPGSGTCYLAMDPLGSFVETVRHRHLVPADLDDRALTSGTLNRTVQLFDATSRSNRFGLVAVTAALSAGLLADAQAAATQLLPMVAGVWYAVRHDPAQRLVGLAIFGDAGVAETSSVLDDAKTTEIPDDVVEQAVEQFHYIRFSGPPLLP